MPLNPINNASINSEPVNGSGSGGPSSPSVSSSNIYGVFNSCTFNAIEVDGGKAIITENSAENTAEVRQKVVINIATTNIISISQDVQLQNTIQEQNIISFSQDTRTLIANTSICSVVQSVIDLSENTFLSRNNYTPVVTIDGRVLPDEMIFGDIQVIYEEGQNNQAILGVLVQNPVEFIDVIWGKGITIDYLTSDGGYYRMFTGVVSIPEIDLINRSIKLTCSNNRDEIVNNTLSYLLPSVGRYSVDVQGVTKDSAENMRARLTTIPKSLDFDGYNTPTITSWFAKTTPHVTITADEIYYRQPKVVWQDRTKIKNSETINITYQYTRLYHYERPFYWAFPYTFCQFLQYQYSLPTAQMILDAIDNAGWKYSSSPVFTDVFPPGTCAFGAVLVAWNTTGITTPGTYSIKFDALGNIITDSDGNSVYEYTRANVPIDLSTSYTIEASWSAATRFSQYIVENYPIVVRSTQSIGQFGTVSTTNNISLKDDFDDGEWEDFKKITPAPADAVTFGTNCYYFNEDTNPAAVTNAILTSIDVAKTNIYSTHRNTFVIAETPIKPELNLSQTVQMSSDLITAKGKVQKIVHTIAVAEGSGSSTEITLALFRSKSVGTETPTYAPSRIPDTISIPNTTVTLPSYYGISNDSYSGYIGNKNNSFVQFSTVAQTPRTSVSEEFRVDTPSIPDAYRKVRNLYSSQATFDLNIPNDLLEVILP
jgi:hypothetical protein